MRFMPILAVLMALILAACGSDDPSSSPAASVETSTDASPDLSPGENGQAMNSYAIIGTEYAFEDVPSEVPAGSELIFINEGQEAHEMLVVRRNDDSTVSFEEVARMDQTSAEAEIQIIGQVVAAPGETAPESIVLTEPGDYALICFFPIAPGEDDDADDLTQHFKEGMLATFTVTSGNGVDPGTSPSDDMDDDNDMDEASPGDS